MNLATDMGPLSPNQHLHRGVVITAFETQWYRHTKDPVRVSGPHIAWQAVLTLPSGKRRRCGFRLSRKAALAWGIALVNRYCHETP